MARVQVLYWQDIPSVVRVGDVKRQLPEWFQQEIDRVAMEQGLLGSDAYLEQWEWRDLGERDADPAVAADEVEAELVARYSGSQPS
ncbi:MAG: virulence factor [Gaiellaceae bacterium]